MTATLTPTLTATIENGELVIRIPVNSPMPDSSSGKTQIVASSHGNVKSDLLVDGKPVVIGLNAYVYKNRK